MPGRGAVAGLLASAGLGLAVVTGGVGAAAADPVLPVDPAIPLPAPGDPAAPPPADAPPADLAAAPADPAAVPNAAAEPPSLLGQFAQVAQSNPLATMKDLIGAVPQPTMMLGATPLPPEVDTTYLKPGQDPLSLASQLKPQNFRMPSPDQASPYALSPNDNPSPFARVNAFKGVHAITHSSLGRMPGSELGQPLPGTAPRPGPTSRQGWSSSTSTRPRLRHRERRVSRRPAPRRPTPRLRPRRFPAPLRRWIPYCSDPVRAELTWGS